MAYVNVAEWKPEQVTEWLKGLDGAVLSYIHSFLNNEVSGQQLLNLRPDDLDHLGVHKLGHQEIILEAVDHLRNFHYELDRENLQLLALRLSCKAHSLCNELTHTTETPVSTQTLADVASIITAVKPLVCWLDGSPFAGQLDYRERRGRLLRPSLEIATVAHRDRFAEAPVSALRDFSGRLAREADSIIQEVLDPLVLQPASLDLATLKKRAGDDLGILIVPSFHGVHQIAEIKYSSPAHSCGKIEEGDEVVQVNYQTVRLSKQAIVFPTVRFVPDGEQVGWQSKQVIALLEECQTDVFLTLKKRPRHTKVYGQIYMKPYRLPSKKRSAQYSRWHDSLPSPRPELLTIPDFEMPLPRVAAPKPAKAPPPAPLLLLETHSSSSDEEEEEEEDDDSFLATGQAGAASPTSARLYLPKPRVTVQRRATVTGASPTSKRPPVNVQQFWRELRLERQWKDGSEGAGGGGGGGGGGADGEAPRGQLYQLRDKSVSFGNGFVVPRPSTCLGIETKRPATAALKAKEHPGKKVKPMEHITESSPIKSAAAAAAAAKPLSVQEEELLELLRTQHALHPPPAAAAAAAAAAAPVKSALIDSITVRSVKKDVRFPEPDARDGSPPAAEPPPPPDADGSLERMKERGRLDKSFSTPAYDTSEESTESSPIEKTFTAKAARPKPPRRSKPRPREPAEAHDAVNAALVERRLADEAMASTAGGMPDYHEIGEAPTQTEMARLGQLSMALSLDNRRQYERVEICVTPPEPPPRPGAVGGGGLAKGAAEGAAVSEASAADRGGAKTPAEPTKSSPPAVVGGIGGGVGSGSVGGGGVAHRAMQAAKSLGRNVNGRSVFSSATLPSPRSVRKKNALIAKRRNVSVADLGTGHLEGWLHHRRRASGAGGGGGGGGATWSRGWFVLRAAAFYGFAARTSGRAQLMIALPGFTSSPAHEVKSRKFAFKVYHTGTVFYFAAETEEELTTWLDAISAATLRQEVTKTDTVVFSESDEGSDTEMPLPSPKNRMFAGFLGGYSGSQNGADSKSPEKRFGSLKKLGRKHDGGTASAGAGDTAALSLDRKYLRIFSGRPNVPVPTAHFRSYRRQPTAGTRSPATPASPASPASPTGRSQFYLSAESVFHAAAAAAAAVAVSVKKSATFDDVIALNGPPSYDAAVRGGTFGAPGTAAAAGGGYQDPGTDGTDDTPTETPDSLSPVDMPEPGEGVAAAARKLAYHYACEPDSGPSAAAAAATAAATAAAAASAAAANRIRHMEYRERNIHASNPSLLIPSDVADYRLAAERLREFGVRRNRQREDTSGFVTLEEFMLSRQEEERRQRGDPPPANHAAATAAAATPAKEAPPTAAPRKTSFNAARVKQADDRDYRGGSPEKQWIDSLRRTDASRKPVTAASPRADLAANRLKAVANANANHSVAPEDRIRPAFEMHLDKSAGAEPAVSKSSKFRALFGGGKAHATNAISPGGGGKTLLGSPRLHRAIFKDRRGGGNGGKSDSSSGSLSSPASPPFDWPPDTFAHAPPDAKPSAGGVTMGVTMLGKKPPPRRTQPPSPSPSQSSPPPDYPGLEYPPVFEAETYTLSDASTLMRAKKTN